MKQYTITSQKTISSPTFNLKPTYDINGLTSVFLNGTLQQPNQDYFIDQDKIVFGAELDTDDAVDFNYVFDTDKSLISLGKTDKKSMLARYNSAAKLNENNKYTINIAIDKDNYQWSFNTKQNPMFTIYKKIYEDIGEFIEGFTEEYINSKIYENSLAVIDLIDSLKENDVENVTYSTDEDGFYTTTYKAVSNWVRFKTDIDLVMARYFGISYRYGTELKEIGDIKIEKTTKLPYIDNLLALLKKQFDEADKVIRGVNVVASSVKAGTRYKYDDWDRDTTW